MLLSERTKETRGHMARSPARMAERGITWQAEPPGWGACAAQRRDREGARLRTSAVRNAKGAASCGSKPRPPLR